MTEEGQPLYISRPVQGFAEDPGLDEQSVADMTADEVKEYLTLLLQVLRPELPSLTWLRRAASRPLTPEAATHGATPTPPHRKTPEQNAISLLLKVLRKAPAEFEPLQEPPARSDE